MLMKLLLHFNVDKLIYMLRLMCVYRQGEIVQTTVGRVVLFEALPKGSDFHWVNKVIKKSDLTKLVEKFIIVLVVMQPYMS